jgi:UDP-glucosyltransferase BX8/BX9
LLVCSAIEESLKNALVHELPPFRVKDLQRIDSSSLVDCAGVVGRVVAAARHSSGLILNTLDAIEAADVNEIRSKLSVPVFAVGPLHKLSTPPTRPQDRAGCLEWLDAQAPRSVLFVSLGTAAAIDAPEFVELARGVAGSKRPFLWVVVRASLVRDFGGELPGGTELEEEIHGRGKIVPWAPQEEVLAHPAIGAFLTHNVWNSTVEAVSEGVPMICRPCFGDQLGAARYVCHMWRVGVELEVGTRLQRWNVEAATEKLMDGTEGKEVSVRTKDLNESTDECINERGSSYTALLGLVDLMLSF